MAAAALLVALTLVVAFANGANDVSKGIATLVGSGVTDYRRAILWGTVWTVAGGIAAAFASQGLVAVFSGKGVLATPPVGPVFLVAVTSGAIGWLVLATSTGLPVSTTHALVGGLVGAGLAAQGVGGVAWAAVARKVALPLAMSPLLSLALVVAVFPVVGLAFRRLNHYCVCVERQGVALVPVAAATPVSVVSSPTTLHVLAGGDCPPQVLTRLNALDSLHWLSAGCTSFFRGLNDAPKILALGVGAAATVGVTPAPLFLLVALAMGAGSHVAGRRVTQTLAGRVTRIAPNDGLAASLVTSALVGLASAFAAPVSTTHVSSGAIVGIGAHTRDVRWKVVREMLLAWLVTLPVAGVLAGFVYLALTRG